MMQSERRHPIATAAPGDDERGAVAVIVAILMVLLASMAAFAIDLGSRHNVRRNAQAAVDLGLLSGAQDVPFSTNDASERIAQEIRANLEVEYTDAEWEALWTVANCTDPDRFDIMGSLDGVPTQCISFDDTGRARVRLPDLQIDTIFAGLMGVDAMTVNAQAEVFVKYAGIGGVLPFTVLGGAEDGSQICLRSSSSGSAIPPCEGAQSGNFHALEISIYGDPAFETETIACNTNKNDVFTINVAKGIDHLLRVKLDGDAGVTDSCAKPFGPNQFYTQTGIGNGLWEGLVAGETIQGVDFEGRLTDIADGGTTIDLLHEGDTHTIDNTPIWQFIAPGLSAGSDLPASCLRETFEAMSFADATANIETCLTDYKAGDYVVDGETMNDYVPWLTYDGDGNGEYDVETSRRFAIVPQTAEESLPNGKKVVTIAGFKAVWVQGLYFPNGGTPVIVEPGQPSASVTVPSGGSPLDQVTGWLLPDSVVDSIIGLTDEAGGQVTGSNTIELIR